MPPCARHPTISYWSATTSPATSFGLKENGPPHLRQKPSSRPGWPSRDRPTGSPQRAQKRRFSATSALAMIASDGSRWGTPAALRSSQRLLVASDQLGGGAEVRRCRVQLALRAVEQVRDLAALERPQRPRLALIGLQHAAQLVAPLDRRAVGGCDGERVLELRGRAVGPAGQRVACVRPLRSFHQRI